MRPQLVAVGAVLCALVGAGEATRPDASPPPAAGTATVVGASVVCPDVAGAEVVAGATGSGPGTLQTRLPGAPYTSLPLAAAGQVVGVGRNAAAPGVLAVRAGGAVAAGLGVELRSRNRAGPVRGLSALRCGPAVTSAWFVGGGTAVGQRAQLVLANPDDSPALLDVTGWSSTGPLERRPGRGIAVPAQGSTVVELDTVAPDRDLLALHVQTTRGRVAAALRHVRADGRVALGVDWVPLTGPPAREVLVAGLAQGPGGRTLVVTNPGADATTVDLQLVTDDGLVDLAPLDVPAGTSVSRSLTEELSATPATVRVRSQAGPVLAGALVQVQRTGLARELAWAGAAPVLTGPALLAEVTVSPVAEQTLLLTAPELDAVVELVPLPVAGQPPPPAGRRIEVPGGTTVGLALSMLLPPGSSARLALELRTSGGPVVAARSLRERSSGGPLIAMLPVASSPGLVRRPAVRADPLAGH